MPEQQGKLGRYALVLLVLGAIGRLPAIALPGHSPMVVYFDGSYIQTAQAILHLNFSALGNRTPVYPLLLLLCGFNPRAIWIAQSILGIAASLMIFDMAFRRTCHGLFSLLVGLACSLAPEVLIYESSIMTEALTNFLLVASIWVITRFDDEGKIYGLDALGLGLIVALMCLTRPLMLCLLPVYFCFLVPLWPPSRILQREVITRALSFAIPVIVLIFGWCGLIYFNTGSFTPTTLAGHNLMDQVDPYVELAPEQYSVLREAWGQFRLYNQHFPNKNANPVFDEAVLEVQRRTGKTKAQVSREYQSLAVYLATHHPLLYLRRAEQGWIQFWAEPTLDETEWPQVSAVSPSEFQMTMTNFLLREVEAVFLILALLSIPFALVRLGAFTKLEYLTFAIVLWVSVFAALTEFGENRRFCVPFYMLIAYTLLTRGWLWVTATTSKGPHASPVAF
jgi:hypothetical protein